MTVFSALWRNDTVNITSRRNYLERGDGAVGLAAPADFSKLDPWKFLRRCTVADDGTINAFYGQSTYKDDGSDGMVMNYLKKFYSQVTTGSTGGVAWKKWSVSNDENDGLPINPAFVSNSIARDYVLFGSFIGSLNPNTGRLESVSSKAGDLRKPYLSTATDLATTAIARTATQLPVNCLTPACANGAESATLETAFTTYNGSTLASSTDTFTSWPPFGKRSVKVTTASPAVQNSGVNGWHQRYPIPTPGGEYTFSFYAYTANPSVQLQINIYEYQDTTFLGAYTTPWPGFPLSTGAHRYAWTITMNGQTTPGNAITWAIFTTYNYSLDGAVFYIDGLQYEPYTSGRSTLDPGGNPTNFHVGSWPYVEKRSGTGWGMVRGQTWAALQTLNLVENALWCCGMTVPMSPELLGSLWGYSSFDLLGTPSPTSWPYIGRTGSYGKELGSQSGTVYGQFLEMYASPPTDDFGSVGAYRGVELPWSIPTVVDGMVLDVSGSNTTLFVADDQLNFIHDGYTDVGISIPAGNYSAYITDWALGSTAKWFFLPSTIGSTPTTMAEMCGIQPTPGFPAPVLYGAGGNALMFGSDLGIILDGATCATRLQYTPEGSA